MVAAMEALNVRLSKQGRPPLAMGVGIATGPVVVGPLGTDERLEYTVIGDTVNTASRLCSAAGPREILISDEFRRALTAPPALVEMPPMELKGKSQPVPVYRVTL
jgi:adenylate cyclase